MPGGLWRAMFKLQFFRTTAPCGPSWNCTPVPRPFKDSGDSKTKQAIWEAVWCWLTGEQNVVDASVVAAWLASGDEVQLLPVQIYNVQIHIINWLAAYRLAGSKHPSCCAEQIGDLERTVQSSNREIDRVGAAYALGSLAGNDIVSSRHRQQDALKALDRLLEGQNNARRAAMYGIASAGMSAVDLLVERIRGWLEGPGAHYERILLALPGHHGKLVRDAAEGLSLPMEDLSISACRSGTSCGSNVHRATSEQYRRWLRRKVKEMSR